MIVCINYEDPNDKSATRLTNTLNTVNNQSGAPKGKKWIKKNSYLFSLELSIYTVILSVIQTVVVTWYSNAYSDSAAEIAKNNVSWLEIVQKVRLHD